MEKYRDLAGSASISFGAENQTEAPPVGPGAELESDSHRPGKYLVLARKKARSLGDDWLSETLRASLHSWSGKVQYTLWSGNHRGTFGGTPTKRGKGRHIKESLEQYATRASNYAKQFHEKGHGTIVAHGVSRYGGSTDAECVSRHWIYCDADEVGDWDRILAALDALNVSYFAQRSGSHTPERPKFHLELPLARPLVPSGSPSDHESWPAWGVHVREWKGEHYRAQLGWILGLLSELGGLLLLQNAPGDYSHLGFDAKNDRLLCLDYWGCRRTKEAIPPEVRFRQTDLALDWESLLSHSGFAFQEESRFQKPHKPSYRNFLPVPSLPLVVGGAEGKEALQRLAAGLLPSLANLPQRGGVFRSLAGALLRRGVPADDLPAFFASLSSFLGEPSNKQKDRADLARLKARDFQSGVDVAGYGMLKDEFPNVAAALDAVLPASRGAEKARLLADALGVFDELSLDAVQQATLNAFRDAVSFEGLHVVKITEGAGKSWAATQFAEERAKKGLKTAFATYSHHMADDLAARLSVPVERLRSVVAAKTDGEFDCAFHPQLKVLAAGGQNPVTSLCLGLGAAEGGGNQPCPHARTCPAFSKLGSLRGSQALVAIGVVDHMPELLAWLGNDGSGLLFLDEDPGAVETLSLSPEDLDHALNYASRFQAADVGWRNVVLRAIRAGLAEPIPRPSQLTIRKTLNDVGVDEEENEPALLTLLRRGAFALVRTAWQEQAERFYGTTDPLAILHQFADRAAFKDNQQLQRREQWAPYRSGSLARRIFNCTFDAAEASAFELASRVHACVAQAAAATFRFRGERALSNIETETSGLRGPRSFLRIVRWRLPVSLALDWASRGGSVVLLDATAQPLLLNALAGAKVPCTEIRVQDGAPVSRLLLYYSHATRRDLLPYGLANTQTVSRLLQAALDEVLARFPENPVVGLVSWRGLLDTFDEDSLYQTFWKFHQAGGRVVLPENSYYGNLRGRNDWLDEGGVDAFLSLGDDRPNLGAVEAVSKALGLSADFQAVYDALTSGNLSQAHGRTRAPRREKPLLAIHIGAVIPSSWDARIETKALPEGRPSNFSPEQLEAALLAHEGDLRATAKTLELHWSKAVQEKLKGLWEKLLLSRNQGGEGTHLGWCEKELSAELSDSAFEYQPNAPEPEPERPTVEGGERIVERTEEARTEELRAWVSWAGGLMKGAYLLRGDRGMLNERYQGREPTSEAYLGELAKVRKEEWAKPGNAYAGSCWEYMDKPVPIEKAAHILRDFGVSEEDIGLLCSWSKGLNVSLAGICHEELLLLVPGISKERVSLLVDDLRRCDPPWFVLVPDW